MTTPTIPELAPKGPTVTTAEIESAARVARRINEQAILKREKMIRTAMTVMHSQAVEAARARVPQITTKPGATGVSERGRLLRARKFYSQTKDRCFNRATRRANAKLICFA